MQDLRDSINNRAYYRRSLALSLKESLIAYAKFALILALATTVLVTILIIPQIPSLFDGGVTKWLSQIPAERPQDLTPDLALQLQTFVDSWQGRWPVIAPLLVLLSFILVSLILALQLINFLLWALVTWWMTRRRSWMIKYRQAYQLTLIAARPSLILSYLGFWFLPSVVIGIASPVIFVWILWRNLTLETRP